MINLHNDIRDGGVGQRFAETHRLLTGAVYDVLDLKLGGGFLQVCNRCIYCGLIFKEDKGNVIRSNPCHIDTCCRSNEGGVNLAV